VLPAFGSQPTTIGKYAYWVSDEGVKAKVNLTDPTLGITSNMAAGQAHFLAPQANAIHKISGLMVDPTTDFRAVNAVNLSKVISPNSISFLSTTPTGLDLKPYQTDITTYSNGVLADVKNGGLKKDLTAAFETGSEYAKLVNTTTGYGFGKRMLYRSRPGITIPFSLLANTTDYTNFEGVTDGLPWISLYTYYNTYKSKLPQPNDYSKAASENLTAIDPTTKGESTATPSLNEIPYKIKPRFIAQWDGTSNPNGKWGRYGGLIPDVISWRMDIALASYQDPVTSKWKLAVRYYPQLVLYNPYNCILSQSDFAIQKKGSYFYEQYTTNKYRITVKVDGATVASNVILNQADRFSLQNKTFIDMYPGETRVYGLDADIQKTAVKDSDSSSTRLYRGLRGAITASDLVSTPDMSNVFAYWTDLTDKSAYNENQSFQTGSTVYTGTTNMDAEVQVSISYNDSNAPITRFFVGDTDTYVMFNNSNSNVTWPNMLKQTATFADQWTTQHMGPGLTPYNSLPNSLTSFGPISGLLNPRSLTGFFIRKKGLNKTSTTTSYYNGDIVTAPYHGNAPHWNPLENTNSTAWSEFYTQSAFGQPYTSTTEIQQIKNANDTWETYYGNSSVGIPQGSGVTRRVLRDVPNQPLISLGQFMHMPTNIECKDTSNKKFGFRDTGSMFIGGSLVNPFIATNFNLMEYSNTSLKFNMFDDSFLANDSLFDRFYLSTIPPLLLPANTGYPQQWIDFNIDNPNISLTSTNSPLPNSRIKTYARNGVAPMMADLRDFDKAAANLLLDGAFNVNSTSIDAWKALLSSLSGNDMSVYNSALGTKTSITAGTLNNVIPRFWSSATTGAVNTAWEGNRALSDAEITELATRIVEQVKLRGPFLSMSDFLNRRLGPDSAMTRVGCLQAAIDTTVPDINQNVKAEGATITATGFGMPLNSNGNSVSVAAVIATNLVDGAGNALNSAVGIPGYLMQQDIVQAFSSAMTVRSDTFVIRTYGESINPASGATQSKAWAEAVVQRVPEFMDTIDAPNAEKSLSSLNATNQNFGRRFKIIGFRWLSPHDL
jgi:hypothetical protein